jgi:hypothetical protein
MHVRTSAEPEKEVCARLPCFAVMSNGEAIMEEVVEMLNVECESPPVPTMSHYFGSNQSQFPEAS